MKSNKRIFFISPSPKTGFIKNDLDILRRNYHVKTAHYDYENKVSLVLLIPRIIKGVIWADALFIWFASFHALFSIIFSKLFMKKSILIVGGYEVINAPKINYGLMKSVFTSWIPKFSIKYSNIVICISNSSKNELLKFIRRDEVKMIYNAIDTDKFKRGDETRKENIVLTVGNLYKSTFKLKGLQIYFDVAKCLPEIQFIFVGDIDPEFKKMLSHKIPNNVFLTGRLTTHQLLPFFQKAKVYCQLSYYESFGVALAESMACECIPVVTGSGALQEVVGNVGFYVPYGDVFATIEAINEALISDNGKKVRNRIIEKFSITDREKDLLKIFRNLWNDNEKGSGCYSNYSSL